MLIFLNDRFVAEQKAVVSVSDRSFLYGDGLFEAVPILNGNPFRWAQHMERFQNGAKVLKIAMPFSSAALKKFAGQLIAKNKMPEALLRITLSRGVGVRGYSPKGADNPTLVMTLHPPAKLDLEHPPKWKVITSSIRLPASEPLALFKTCNKLPQIMARAQADAAGAQEALLSNTDGFVVEGTTSNLFWIRDGTVCTPPLASGILPGVTRAVVLEICRALKIRTREIAPRPKELLGADGVFLSMSSYGIAEVVVLDGRSLRRSACVEKIRRSYQRLLSEETR